MARAKNGTRMSHISLISDEVDSTWISNHYNGLIDNVNGSDTLLDETGSILLTENNISLELDSLETNREILTISFVGDDRPTPNSTSGEFKAY